MLGLAVRVDASTRIGSGHVMRCMTLADAFRKRGAEVRFACRAHPGHLTEQIEANGFPVALMAAPPDRGVPVSDTDYAAWLGVTPEADAAETVAALDGWRPDWLVVDHYGLDATWEEALRPHVGAILALDDLANRPHACDVLLDQNHHADAKARYAGLVSEDCRLLCGPRFALLRPEYAAMRSLQRGLQRRGPAVRVMVYYGGVDATNETARALRVLSEPAFAHLAVDVVLGTGSPRCAEVAALAAARHGTVLYGARPHLADVMARADIALGAGGATTWERCALGLPTLLTVLAENQVGVSESLVETGAARIIGRAGAVGDNDVREALGDILRTPEAVGAMAVAAEAMGDAMGTQRVAEVIAPSSPKSLRLRHARPDDASHFFTWLNDHETRRQSFHPEPVPWASHAAWFAAALETPDRFLRVVETAEGLAVGQVRLDRIEACGLISYGLDPIVRGRGWGARVLHLAVAEWRRLGGDAALHGFVRPGNAASIRSFERVGFVAAPESHPLAPAGSVDMVWRGADTDTKGTTA